VLLRRTKEAVAPELPPRQEQELTVELALKHRHAYDTHLQRERQHLLGLLANFTKNRFAIFRSLTVLRRLALDASLVDPKKYRDIPSAKLDTLFDQLAEIIAGGHRALVFSQFTTFLAKVRVGLEKRHIDYAYLDGATTHRAEVIRDFREGTAPVFCLSLKAGGFGINLTEADYVFLLDPWWNPATEQQAIDRTHRIGQTKPVMVIRLISQGTIEEKVMALKARKAELFDAVLGDDEAAFSAALSADDVRALLLDD
jgi:SNF2 family DNA or RNA helicase